MLKWAAVVKHDRLQRSDAVSAGHPQAMLTDIYLEALLANDTLAD